MNNTNLLYSPWNFLKKIFEFFFPTFSQKLFGKLFVSGAGTLEFTFKDCPNNVFVYFDDESQLIPCTPCDPGQEDKLDWQIIEDNHMFTLVIDWEVNSIRTICWKVCS